VVGESSGFDGSATLNSCRISLMTKEQLKLSIRCLAVFIEAGSADQAQRSEAARLLRQFADEQSLAEVAGDAVRRGRPSKPIWQLEIACRVEQLTLDPATNPEGQNLGVTEAWRVVASEYMTSEDNVRKAHQKHKARAEAVIREAWVFGPDPT